MVVASATPLRRPWLPLGIRKRRMTPARGVKVIRLRIMSFMESAPLSLKRYSLC
jgi:hypothetical protein